MKKIHTVTGEILPEKLGFCHSHEHLLLSRGESFRKSPVLLLDDFDRSLAEVKAYAAAGGRAIVEAQPVGCNRVADGLEFMGIGVDPAKNEGRGEDREVTAEGACVRTFVISTDEELMIALDAQELTSK